MLFSSRLPSNLDQNAFSQALEAKKKAGLKIFDLTQANPTAAGFSCMAMAAWNGAGLALKPYEPSAQGLKSAREAIRHYYQRNTHGDIDSDDLLLTASTSEAYSYLLKLLTEPGDEVLIPAPSYPLFDFLTTLENVRPGRYRLQENTSGHWRIDFSSLEEEISRLTRAVIVVNPNNPTGSCMTGEELQKLSELCLTHDLALIVDEVFLDYANPGSKTIPCSAVSADTALTFTLSGFSKILGLPQAKLSWIHVNGPKRLKELAKQHLEFIADTYLSVNGMIQEAAKDLLPLQGAIQQEIVGRISRNSAFLQEHLGLDPHLREGGWYAVFTLPENLSDEQCCVDLLKRFSVMVHPGYFYDFAEGNRIVISLLTPEEDLRQGILLLHKYLQTHAQ